MSGMPTCTVRRGSRQPVTGVRCLCLRRRLRWLSSAELRRPRGAPFQGSGCGGGVCSSWGRADFPPPEELVSDELAGSGDAVSGSR